MNLWKLIVFGVSLILSLSTHAQKENQECERLNYAAKKALIEYDYRSATTYLLKGEMSCEEYDQSKWETLLACLKSVINEEVDNKDLRTRYIDTLINAWDRQELAGFYNKIYDLDRATFEMQSTTPNFEKADQLFQRGIKAQGSNTHEAYLAYAYYATYSIFQSAQEEKKSMLRKRMLSDYFFYSNLSDTNRFSDLTQQTLDYYFDYVFPYCSNLLPEVQDYIETLPKDTTAAVHAIQQMTVLLEEKECTENKEYEDLIDAWLNHDPNSLEANYRKDPSSIPSNPIDRLDYIEGKITDPKKLEELKYRKAYTQFKAGQYHAAYSTGLTCTGEYKSKGMYIAAQCVAAMAMSCGNSTFERKCNYIYAAELAEAAGQEEAAEKYREKGPHSSDCGPRTNSSPVELTCWGVSVKPCP